jgi:hypothetical protein
MTPISNLGTAATALLLKSSFAASTASSSASTATQSGGTSTTQATTTAPSSATPSAEDIAAAKAAAANSGSYSFSVVAQNALTTLNANIKTLGITLSDSTTGAQSQQIFGSLDRRSMYAVASNEGGQFTTLEQQMASYYMNYQLTVVQGNVSAAGSDSAAMADFNNSIKFLQNVSPEEKASVGWAMDMAAAKTSYNDFAADAGEPAQTSDGTNPLVKMLMAAMKAAQSDASKDMTVGQTDTLSGILSQPWAQGFESEIQQAYAVTVRQGSSLNTQA